MDICLSDFEIDFISNLQITEHHIIVKENFEVYIWSILLFTEEKSNQGNGGNQMLCETFLKNY